MCITYIYIYIFSKLACKVNTELIYNIIIHNSLNPPLSIWMEPKVSSYLIL